MILKKEVTSKLGHKYWVRVRANEHLEDYWVTIWDSNPDRKFLFWKPEPVWAKSFNIEKNYIKAIQEMIDHLELHESHRNDFDSWDGDFSESPVEVVEDGEIIVNDWVAGIKQVIRHRRRVSNG